MRGFVSGGLRAHRHVTGNHASSSHLILFSLGAIPKPRETSSSTLTREESSANVPQSRASWLLSRFGQSSHLTAVAEAVRVVQVAAAAGHPVPRGMNEGRAVGTMSSELRRPRPFSLLLLIRADKEPEEIGPIKEKRGKENGQSEFQHSRPQFDAHFFAASLRIWVPAFG